MQTIDQSILDRASLNWQNACFKLGVRIQAPYKLEVGEESGMCIAFLPDFGGHKGMVIGAMDLPQIGTDPHLEKICKEAGVFYSFVNVSAYASTKPEDHVFKEALEDWGYFGSADKCPSWFKRPSLPVKKE